MICVKHMAQYVQHMLRFNVYLEGKYEKINVTQEETEK